MVRKLLLASNTVTVALVQVKNNPKVHEVMGSQEFLPFEQMYVSPSLEAECLKKGHFLHPTIIKV